LITQERLIELFNYRDGNLYWAVSPNPRIKIGSITSQSVNSDGRKTVVVDKKRYLLSRIIFLRQKGYLPDFIDHIDGNSLNNKVNNLREVSQMINAKNTSRTCKSNTGVTGVTCVIRKRLGFKQYIASWYNSDDKLTSKEFSSHKLGEEEAFRLACEWRKEQIRLLNEQGAGYTERHGT